MKTRRPYYENAAALLWKRGGQVSYVETRGGNPDGTVRAVDKPVKYLRVVDPPTVDKIATDGADGIVQGEAFVATGANPSFVTLFRPPHRRSAR